MVALSPFCCGEIILCSGKSHRLLLSLTETKNWLYYITINEHVQDIDVLFILLLASYDYFLISYSVLVYIHVYTE